MSAMRKGMGASTLTGFPEGLLSGASGFVRTGLAFAQALKNYAGVEKFAIPNF